MTHQYESEILNKLMERDGFNIPSSVPPYEAEIKAYLINQVKQAYPKLTDYEAEWLLYNYTKHLPAEFPISSVTNAASATFENVVPFAYQSAILKGQTLTNIAPNMTQSSLASGTQPWKISGSGKPVGSVSDNRLKISAATDGSMVVIANVPNTMKPTTKYYVQVEVKNNSDHNVYFYKVSTQTINLTTGLNKFIITTVADFNINNMMISIGNTGSVKMGTEFEFSNLMIIQYQDGMENWDIPYFEGMHSVKKPVLTTTGKNLIDLNAGHSLSGGFTVIDEMVIITGNNDYRRFIIPMTLEKGTYTLQGECESGEPSITVRPNSDGSGNQYANTKSNKSFTLNEKTTIYVSLNTGSYVGDVYFKNIQLEEGSVATSYEPYETNILTVNEDVELRGIGDVKDELNLMTGEITERIGEISLDGSENWRLTTQSDDYADFRIMFDESLKSYIGAGGLCDKLKYQSNKFGSWIITDEGITIYNNYVILSVLKTRLQSADVSGIKTWLSQNPITVQYELETPTVKTVDLTTVNEKGETTYFMPLEGTMHVSCNSQNIQPTFDMSVPVEATTQNLASFIDLELEE